VKIANYQPATGLLISVTDADQSPLEPGVFLVPAAATADLPPAFDAATHRAILTDGDWRIEAIPAPPAPAAPAIEDIRATLLADLRTRRALAMNVLDGLQVDALTDGDTATAAAIRAAKQACRNLPALDVSAASDEAGIRARYLARWREIAAAVPAPVRVAFAGVLA
jgi:hypothetical protein